MASSAVPAITCCLQVQVLGPFVLCRDGRPVPITRWPRRAASLFRLLATAPERRLLRDDVLEAMWPEATPEAAASNLRYALHRLRQGLPPGDPPLVRSERDWLGLNQSYRWEVDLASFEQAVRSASEDLPALEQAAELYRGEPLVEDRYEDWAHPVRERVQRTWRDLCLRLGELHRGRGAGEDAARWLERPLESDPLDEEAVQMLLQVLADLGRRTEAVRRYQQFEQRLREELDVPPEPETVAVITKLKSDLQLDPPRDRLPSSPSESSVTAVFPSYPLPTAGPCMGRTTELQTIVGALPVETARPESSVTPALRLVLVAAEAGLGKTRLLGEVAQQAREGGMLILAGGCCEQEGRLPYGPIHDALLDYLRAQPETVLRTQLGDLLGDLVRVVPELRETIREISEIEIREPEGQRLRLFSAVARAFERISRDRPLVLLLDDLQWADDASLQLLHYLLRQPGQRRELVVGTYRPEETSDEGSLGSLRREAMAAGWGAGLSLAPLEEGDLRLLLEERLAGPCAASLVQALHTRSGGNPLFALLMARLLQQEGRLQRTADGWEVATGLRVELPHELREAVARRLHRLPEQTREVLILGSVLGREFAYAALEGLWEGERRDLFAALDTAVGRHLVGETEEGYVFRHPLLWEVVYDRIPKPRRALLHGRAGLALEALYGDQAEPHAAELAHHFVAAGRQYRGRAIHYLTMAGDVAARAYAWVEAQSLYGRALELTDDQAAAGLREKLGVILRIVGRYDEALDVLGRAAETYRLTADLESVGRVSAQLGRVYRLRGTPQEGIARLQEATDLLAGAPLSAGLAALHLALAQLFFASGAYQQSAVAAERAEELARAARDERALAEAGVRRGTALGALGRPEEAQRIIEAAIPLAEAVGDLETLSLALGNVGVTYWIAGRLDRARPYCERALAIAERLGDPVRIGSALVSVGDLYFDLGDWKQARPYLERAVDVTRAIDRSWSLAFALYHLGKLCLAEGDEMAGVGSLTDCLALAERTANLQALRFAHSLLAEHELQAGHPDAARARIERFLERDAQEESASAALTLLPALARSALGLGEADMAERLAARAVAGTAGDNPSLRVQALRAQAMVLGRAGRWAEAQNALEESLSLAVRIHFPYEEGLTLHTYGMLHLQHGDLQQARARFEQALAIFRRLGARKDVERSEQALLELERR